MTDHPSYQILEEIGHGTRTTVYRAWDNSPLKRYVAIKALAADARTVEPVRHQFWEEVRFLAEHRHERFIPVYSVDNDRDWVIMELADGSVASRIAEGSAAASEVRGVLAQCLEGLVALHSADRLHGQIKPSNLLTFESGHVKLSDPSGAIGGTLEYTLGSEKYLAPELVDPDRWGATIGPQLDLYCLGFCMLELLAGPQFDGMFPGMSVGGADRGALWSKWHASDTDPDDLVTRLAPAGPLRDALSRMLTKSPKERATTADEVLNLLGSNSIPKSAKLKGSKHVAASVPSDQIAASLPQKPATASTPLSSAWPPFPASPAGKDGRSSARGRAAKTTEFVKAILEDTKKTLVAAAVLLGLGVAVLAAISGAGEHESKVQVDSDPSGAEIWVDGRRYPDVITPAAITLKDGGYEVQVKLPGRGQSRVKTIQVAGSEEKNKHELHFTLPAFAKATSGNQPTSSGKSGEAQSSVADEGIVANKSVEPKQTGPTVEAPEGVRIPPSMKNSIGIELRPIPGGEFIMGSEGESGGEDERPTHRVVIPNGLLVSVHEVTVGQFRAFVEATGYRTEAERGSGGHGFDPERGKFRQSDEFSWEETGWKQTDMHPVVNISWNDASTFCEWLSSKENKVYRLPTEAEWEYACRAGTNFRFHSGESNHDLARVGNVADMSLQAVVSSAEAVAINDSHPFTAMVGSFGRVGLNSFGLADMHGNALEWCLDYYDETFYHGSSVTSPVNLTPSPYRVARGGSWYFAPDKARAAARHWWPQDFMGNFTGFRVIIDNSTP